MRGHEHAKGGEREMQSEGLIDTEWLKTCKNIKGDKYEENNLM